jgi:sulfate transport system permease protein
MDPRWSRWLLIGLALVFLGVLLIIPLVAVFMESFRKGVDVFFGTFADSDARHAIYLTLLVAGISVPLNLVFGLAAAWAVTKHDFPGKSLLLTLIDIPFSVSPVVAGLILVLVFGIHGWFGQYLDSIGFQIIFAIPGIVLATVFITFPFVARELIPAMESTGREEEQAAVLLGASGWQILRKITLPNVRWALLYGVLLCNARAMGEFGAVSVVSGHIRGETNTIPLQVEILYNEYNFVAAFAMASLLALLALVTLVAKTMLEWRMQKLEQQVVIEKTRHRDPALIGPEP